jgi:hypothetical protein
VGAVLAVQILDGLVVRFCATLSRVEAGSNTSTLALRDVRGDEEGSQCLGVYPGHPIPGGYKYRDLAL